MVLCIVLFWSWRDRRSVSARTELLIVETSLPLGASKGDVEAACNRTNYEYIRCAPLPGRSAVGFATPLEFGAKNWVLLVEMGDGVVVSKKYRTEDSLREHPPGSPADVSASRVPIAAP